MKKFRSLLLSMVMLVSVCPLYGFTSVKAEEKQVRSANAVLTDGDPETDENGRRERVVNALKKAVEKIHEAEEKIASETIKQLETDAETAESEALEYIQGAYERKDEAEKNLAEYAKNAEQAKSDAADNYEAANADRTAAQQAEKAAGVQEFIAEHTFWYPVADQAAWKAYGEAKKSNEALADAFAQKNAAEKNAAIAKENYDAAQAEYEAATKEIKEALGKGELTSKAAELKTREAAEKAAKVADVLEQAETAAALAQKTAENELSTARDELCLAVNTLDETVKEYSQKIKEDTNRTTATGVTYAFVKRVTDKAIEICDEYAEDEETLRTKIKDLNTNLDKAQDAVKELKEKITEEEKPLANKVLDEMDQALAQTAKIAETVTIEIEEEEVARTNYEYAVDWLKDDVRSARDQISSNASDVRKAGVTLASARIAYKVTTAVHNLITPLYEEAASEKEAAVAANVKAQKAFEEVKALADKGISVNDADLERAETASWKAERDATQTNIAYDDTDAAQNAANESAYEARKAANRLRPVPYPYGPRLY